MRSPLGVGHQGLELGQLDQGGEIEQRPRRAADRNATKQAAIAPCERGGAVNEDAGTNRCPGPWHRHRDAIALRSVDQAPQRRRASVADHRVRTAGQHRGHLRRQRRPGAVTDEVDAGVDRDQAAGPNACRDRAPAEPERKQLAASDHPMLARGEPRERAIEASGGSCRHAKHNPSLAAGAPVGRAWARALAGRPRAGRGGQTVVVAGAPRVRTADSRSAWVNPEATSPSEAKR